MKWSRRKSRQEAAETAVLRQESEAQEQADHVRVRVPLRQMREQNHIAEDIARLIRKGGHGGSGSIARTSE